MQGSPIARQNVPPPGENGVGIDLSATAVAALATRPSFDAAMLASATAMVDLYRGHWALNRLVSDRGRLILGLMILDLHFIAGDGAGFTAAQLREVATAYGACSPGRTTAFVASLRLLGFLAPVAADDRRLRRLVPTERFLDLHRERWRRQFVALALIRAEGTTALAALDNPGFVGAFAHALVVAYRRGLRMADFVPELRPAAERDAALTMLFSLLITAATGQSVSIAALARRFSVSRAHVLTVLREAQQAGLAAPAGPRGGYCAGPALMATLRRFFAILFLLHLHGIEFAKTADDRTAQTIRQGTSP